MSAAAQVLRRVVGVALFDRATCREILYDPRAIYQGLAVLAAVIAASDLWAFVDPEGRFGPSAPAAGPETWTRSAWSALWQTAVGGAVWVSGILAIMMFGCRVMASEFAPSWRSFISLWCFAAAPGAVVSLISTGLSLIGYGADLGRVIVSASLVVLLIGILWGIAVQVHAVRHAFDSESTARASILVVVVWALQSAVGYVI